MGNEKKIVIIDDDESIVEIMAMVLDPLFNLSTYSSALTFLSTHSEPPDMILLDNIMEDCIGTEQIPVIKTLFPNVKIVLMSGNYIPKNKQDIEGVDLFLEKK